MHIGLCGRRVVVRNTKYDVVAEAIRQLIDKEVHICECSGEANNR